MIHLWLYCRQGRTILSRMMGKFYHPGLAGLFAVVMIMTATASRAATGPGLNHGGFDIQFTEPFRLENVKGVIDLDLFDTPKETVQALATAGAYPVCYISVGTLEDWRPDVARFPADLIGKAYDGWDGEFWLDLRQAERLAPAIEARLDLCREKGFKGVDPDNLDGHETDTGFELTSDTQIQFLTWLAAAAHQRGLSIGLKNVPDLAPEISNQFDWIIIEDCHAQSWCGDVTGFIEHGKPVFSIEYTDNKIDFDAACADANKTGHTLVMKHRALDGDYIRRCDPR